MHKYICLNNINLLQLKYEKIEFKLQIKIIITLTLQ